ncbi:MAG: hypothetical protein ABSA33_06625, partial [Candidatus Micrarchaeaceae archaeon]
MSKLACGLAAMLALSTVNTAVAQSAPGGIIQTGPNANGAVTNNNIITTPKSLGEVAAERVQACEVRHNMKIASEKSVSDETQPSQYSGDTDHYIQHIAFRSCRWLSSRYADLDGYLEITITTVDGPGDSNASGTNYVLDPGAFAKYIEYFNSMEDENVTNYVSN